MAHRPWRGSLLPALLILALGASPALARVTKCVDPGGRILFTNVSCPEGFAPEGAPGATTTSPPSAPAPPRREGRSFLWSMAGARNTVYLLGTLHLAPADLYPLGEQIENAYRRSSVVVFEADPQGASDPGLLAGGVYTDGTTLSQHLSERSRELLRRRVREAGLTPAQVEPLKPWLCALVITEATLRHAGIDPAAGIDRRFLSRSRADGKKQIFLETPAFQLGLVAGLEASLQEAFFEKILGDLDQVQALYGQVVRLWRGGDADGLAALLEPGAGRFPLIHERFVLERNRRWLGKLEEFLGMREDVLVVVGAAHLTGSGGLLSMLRAAGHPVEQR